MNETLIHYLHDKAFKYLGRLMYANLKEDQILGELTKNFDK